MCYSTFIGCIDCFNKIINSKILFRGLIMPYDFKKEEKNFYRPKKKPEQITIPKMNFIAIKGKGDPNTENGDYKKALAKLYPVAFTIRMSKNLVKILMVILNMLYLHLKVYGG